MSYQEEPRIVRELRRHFGSDAELLGAVASVVTDQSWLIDDSLKVHWPLEPDDVPVLEGRVVERCSRAARHELAKQVLEELRREVELWEALEVASDYEEDGE